MPLKTKERVRLQWGLEASSATSARKKASKAILPDTLDDKRKRRNSTNVRGYGVR